MKKLTHNNHYTIITTTYTHTHTDMHTPGVTDTLRNSSTGSVTALGRLRDSRKEPFLSRLLVDLRERLRSITRVLSSTKLRLCLQEQVKTTSPGIAHWTNLHRPLGCELARQQTQHMDAWYRLLEEAPFITVHTHTYMTGNNTWLHIYVHVCVQLSTGTKCSKLCLFSSGNFSPFFTASATTFSQKEKGDGSNSDSPVWPNVYEFGLWVVSQWVTAQSTPSVILVLVHYHFNFSSLTSPTLFIRTLLKKCFWFYLIGVWNDEGFWANNVSTFCELLRCMCSNKKFPLNILIRSNELDILQQKRSQMLSLTYVSSNHYFMQQNHKTSTSKASMTTQDDARITYRPLDIRTDP